MATVKNSIILQTLLGIEDVRESAAAMRAAYAELDMSEAAVAPWDACEIEGAILTNIAQYGPQTARELRIGGPGGVVSTSEAIERLALAGQIAADDQGRWYIPEGGAQ